MKKTTKKTKSDQELDSKLVKKIIKEQLKNEETPKKDNPEEETQEEFILISPIKDNNQPKLRTSHSLEETFKSQDFQKEENLEESLIGVETPKKKEDSKEFYNQVSYGSKKEELDQKYGSPIQQGEITQRKEDRGPITVGDIRGNQFTTNGMSSDVRREIAEYASQNPDEKYNVQNLERLDPTDLNRNRNRNPFLQDAEKIDIRYE